MSSIEFQPFDKIARMNRNIVITEKIDGTNAAVRIVPIAEMDRIETEGRPVEFFDNDAAHIIAAIGDYVVFAQSRTRFITPDNDNYGFARWVQGNAEMLVDILGPGTHYGEWWGAGIQRKYGLTGNDKRFSLFNTARWDFAEVTVAAMKAGLGNSLSVVPTLYEGPFSQSRIDSTVEALRTLGSFATRFDKPEGIVIYHTAARQSFKITLEGDEAPKGAAGHALDQEKKAA